MFILVSSPLTFFEFSLSSFFKSFISASIPSSYGWITSFFYFAIDSSISVAIVNSRTVSIVLRIAFSIEDCSCATLEGTMVFIITLSMNHFFISSGNEYDVLGSDDSCKSGDYPLWRSLG